VSPEVGLEERKKWRRKSRKRRRLFVFYYRPKIEIIQTIILKKKWF